MSNLRNSLLKSIQGMVVRKGINEITNECEEISENFAIGFLDWYIKKDFDSFAILPTKELLEMFKNENS